MRFHLLIPMVLALGLASITPCARGDSAGDAVSRGNSAYDRGDYDEALAAYQAASVDMPGSPYIDFNSGAAYYAQGNYTSAADAFEKAALATRDFLLEAKCRYNMGNCAFREGQNQADSDIEKALGACEKSVRHYQEALALDDGLFDAAHNIEVTRLVMKDLLDRLKKQQEEQARKQKQQEETEKELKELIDRQQQAMDKNKAAAEKRQQQPEPDAGGENQQQADEQKDIMDDTRELSDKLKQQVQQAQQNSGQGQATPQEAAREHLDRAASEQALAESRLRRDKPDEALPVQAKALDELRKAMESMTDQPQGQDQQDKQDQEDKQQQPEEGAQDQPESDQGDQEQAQPEAAALDERANDILDEEKENRRRRELRVPGGYRKVDKDW